MPYIRIASNHFDKWFLPVSDPKSFALIFFGSGSEEKSVFEVGGPGDEIATVAAFALTAPDCEITSRYCIRIEPADFDQTGVSLDKSALGQTGVVAVDFRH